MFNSLKLRGSWGKIGDMQSLGNYSYLPGISSYQPLIGISNMWNWYGPDNENVVTGALVTQRVNQNLKWETKTSVNIGVDFDLLNSRLFGSFEWFNSTNFRSPLQYQYGMGYGYERPMDQLREDP